MLPPGGLLAEDYVLPGARADGNPTAQSPALAPFPEGGGCLGGAAKGVAKHAQQFRVAPGQDTRRVGTLEPVWNMFDLTREGRQPDWDEQLRY